MTKTLGALVLAGHVIVCQVMAEMCDTRCAYPHIWDEEKEGMPLEDSEYCKECPLKQLK